MTVWGSLKVRGDVGMAEVEDNSLGLMGTPNRAIEGVCIMPPLGLIKHFKIITQCDECSEWNRY